MFDPIEIEHNGVTKTIKANEIMPLISQVERIISLPRLMESVQNGEPPMGAMSMAYGKILRHAGFNVRDDQVYSEMFTGEGAMKAASDAAQSLLMLMVPPNVLNDKKKADQAEEQTEDRQST